MEKYRYLIQTGILLLLCIMQILSSRALYKDYIKKGMEQGIIKKRKNILIVFVVLAVLISVMFVYEIVQVILL